MNRVRFYLLIIILLFSNEMAYPCMWSVGDTKQCHSVKGALELANNGDTIEVYPGRYAEGNIMVTKSVYLKGIGFPLIDGENENEIFTINADSVEISGFHIKNVGTNYVEDKAGIRISEVSYCLVHHNFLENTFFGIYLEHTSHTRVYDNLVIGEAIDETSSGNAIHAWYCNDIFLYHNYVSGHRDGLYFEFLSNSIIARNVSYRNIRYGMHFMFSDDDSYIKNTFFENGVGVAVMYSKGIKMYKNKFRNNWGGASYGLLLKEMTDCQIAFNKFISNTIALYAESATRTDMYRNDFIQNGWAMKMLGSSTENTIQKNNFLSNTFDLSTNTTHNFNLYSANYWDNYAGYDLDKDGVGDIPYHPVKLFSYFVERIPSSIILMRSLLSELLNYSEKIIPVLTPENLVDKEPLMNRI